MSLTIVGDKQGGNLCAMEIDVLIDSSALPSNRPGIRYTLISSCPLCENTHREQSPLWNLVDRVSNNKNQDCSVVYKMVINANKQRPETIEWVTRKNVGHETKRFIEGTWRCDCGIVFGLSASDIQYLLREITRSLTIEWVEGMIIQLESGLRPDISEPIGSDKGYWFIA